MSIFIPYSPEVIKTYFTELFNLVLTDLTSYETIIITLISNIYFFIFWGFIIYISLKIFNRIWERFF